ncbi:unnamed protein product [Musa acuminata subsp. malaccensis]|uniref:(wild Malaysian banana) hypothetical protein n=1 Tax=Musa acuminata subsp. malaccensis TaxID=214687 RepID=A0A804JSL8_MUSAM|nr:unnamed protein product [Musa acuminata subsp. malaccensis]
MRRRWMEFVRGGDDVDETFGAERGVCGRIHSLGEVPFDPAASPSLASRKTQLSSRRLRSLESLLLPPQREFARR